MDNPTVEKQIAEINDKLNFIVQQLQEQQRRQKELEELKNELVFIGKDALQSVVEELDEVAPYFDTDDLVFLLKKLLRNTRNLIKLMTFMENTIDFFEDSGALGKSAFEELLSKLDELDRKGYFDFIREALKIIDTIVTSFSVDDVRHLRENITPILLTVKNMTQPDMLSTTNNAIGFYKKMDIIIEKDVSYLNLLKKLKDPEVKRGLAFMLEFTKSMANTNGNKNNQTLTKTNSKEEK